MSVIVFKGFKPQKSAYDLLFSAGLQFCDLDCQQKVINCIVSLCVWGKRGHYDFNTIHLLFFLDFFAYLLLYPWYCEICFTVSNGQIHFSHYDPLCFNDCQWKSVAYKCVCFCVCADCLLLIRFSATALPHQQCAPSIWALLPKCSVGLSSTRRTHALLGCPTPIPILTSR